MMYMDPEKIELILEDQIQLHNGRIIPLGENSLFFSLIYPTALGRTFEMELSAPKGAVLH